MDDETEQYDPMQQQIDEAVAANDLARQQEIAALQATITLQQQQQAANAAANPNGPALDPNIMAAIMANLAPVIATSVSQAAGQTMLAMPPPLAPVVHVDLPEQMPRMGDDLYRLVKPCSADPQAEDSITKFAAFERDIRTWIGEWGELEIKLVRHRFDKLPHTHNGGAPQTGAQIGQKDMDIVSIQRLTKSFFSDCIDPHAESVPPYPLQGQFEKALDAHVYKILANKLHFASVIATVADCDNFVDRRGASARLRIQLANV